MSAPARPPRIRALLQWLALGCLSVLLSGCTTARLVYRDPALTRDTLQQGRLVYGAVTALGGGEYIAAEAVIEAIDPLFKKSRPWLHTLPLAEAKRAFPPAEYSAMLQKLTDERSYSEAELAAFGKLSDQARYVLVVDVIESEESSSQTAVYDYDPYWYASYYDFDVVRSARRRARVTFFIYDVQKGKIAWLVTGKAGVGQSRRQRGFQSLYNPIEPPGVPSIVEVTEKIARRAGGLLPR